MAQCLLKFVGKLLFNKVLISGLILLGQGDKQYFFRKKTCSFFYTKFFWTKKCPPKISCHNSERQTMHGLRIIWTIFSRIANLATYQEPTLQNLTRTCGSSLANLIFQTELAQLSTPARVNPSAFFHQVARRTSFAGSASYCFGGWGSVELPPSHII